MADISTKPYLIRALYEWCGDSGYTPYIAVQVDERTKVPREFVKNGEIVLNVSPLATNRLVIDNEAVSFQARFGGSARDLWIPIDNIVSIYAKETGHGMAFEVSKMPAVPMDEAQSNEEPQERKPLTAVPSSDTDTSESPPSPPPPSPGGRPQLKRVK
ncbi:MAG TPA: ClpXP protease specificity-enhancing factor [Burkholderiaceae bacterium]|nr:ClpXP protease specificity-enhancing factor [Burkholderiaceae bacterium]